LAQALILTVDDDAEVLRAISQDIRREFGSRFRVIRVDSGQGALGVTREARRTNEVIALFLVDQRMPGMSGVEFLEAAKKYFPDAKRVLLTAYADTDAAIKAINDVHLDYYLMKPWDPPEERLYPVLSDLLGDWTAGYRPAFDGIRIVGQRWSSESHAMRDFLARNQVPYQWIDIDIDPEATQLLALSGHGATDLPVVILPDDTAISQPTMPDVAGRIGLRHTSSTPLYDLIIVGGGPAGLAAAVYGASEGLRTCIVERHAAGGRPTRARGSRTTSASRPGSPARTWPGEPPPRPSVSGLRPCSRTRRSGSNRPRDRWESNLGTAPSYGGNRSSSPPE